MTNLRKTFIFRITHIENIPHILRYGITHENSEKANPNYVSIGDTSLISTRKNFKLFNNKNIGEYIPFYFAVRTPMLYVIQKGFNLVTPSPPENIVYCVCSVQSILDLNLNFVFTDGHAIDSFSSFYPASDIQKLDEIIDKKAINARYWKDENDLDLKRRKEAEFLILGDIQPQAILGFAVYNEKAHQKLIGFGVTKQIVIKPNYYF
ncbi:type II toxin-antitoxin system toxin DNA ADP-ribosyl transferase DarT [Marinilabilia sp.]